MTIGDVREVKKLAEEVQHLCSEALMCAEESALDTPLCGTPETAALRRRSMDLTRALAEMRQSGQFAWRENVLARRKGRRR